MRKILLLSMTIILFTSCMDGTHNLYSPDKKTRVEILLPAESNENSLKFNIYKNEALISAGNELGVALDSDQGNFHKNIRILSFRQFLIDNVLGENNKQTAYKANGIRFMMANLEGRNMDVVFRIYNEAIAFQYELYNDSLEGFSDEYSSFNISKEAGIEVFALADSVTGEPKTFFENNKVRIIIPSGQTLPLPPRYVLPWRCILLDAKAADPSSVADKLLAQTEYAY